MTTPQPSAPKSAQSWRAELDEIGFVRRLIRARRWYGADWWFVAISGALLLLIFGMGTFPSLFAPYDPRVGAGPGLLAPGEVPETYVLVTTEGGVGSLDQMDAREAVRVGVVIGAPSSQHLRERAEERTEELREAGQEDVRLRPVISRFDTLEAALAALQEGEVQAVAGEQQAIQELVDLGEQIEVGEFLTRQYSSPFYLGTNQIGQDVLSRIIHGTQIALIVSFAAAVFALMIGVPLGLIGGFWPGRLERLLTLFMDSLYSFPGLILAIAIAAVLGPGIMNVILAIATLYVPTYYRIVRGQTLSIKEEMYVDAARSLGARPFEILWRYIFPNVIPSLVVIFSVNVADAILTEAGLAFLGLGLPPDTPDWGIDLAAGQDYMRQAWWLVTFPGAMVTLVTLAFSMLGESLSEIVNPRLREQ
ncbi:MAG: ABC transporter permease [Anaerolineales bacterium]|nr:ABC transporter permease [Anaerolineales bacterium]